MTNDDLIQAIAAAIWQALEKELYGEKTPKKS